MSTTLQRVAPHLIEHVHGQDMLRELIAWRSMSDHKYEPLGWDFDVAEAVYYVGMLWHGGQGCPLYAALCATEFSPGMSWDGPERGSFAAMIAASLVRILGRDR